MHFSRTEADRFRPALAQCDTPERQPDAQVNGLGSAGSFMGCLRLYGLGVQLYVR
jgi:hypothetical protein